MIARVTDDREIWRSTASEMLGGLNVSPDFGWSWQDEGDVLVGTFGVPREGRDGRYEQALPAHHTAGVDARTGQHLWVSEGDLWCGGRLYDSFPLEDLPHPVRCKITGTVTIEPGSPVSYAGVHAVVEAFDPKTGQPRWSTDLGMVTSLLDDSKPLVIVSPTSFASVRDDGTRFEVDLTTGVVKEAAPTTTGWCTSDNHYSYPESYLDSKIRVGYAFHSPCRLDGAAVAAPHAINEFLGVTAGDAFVYADSVGLQAVKLPK